MPRLDHIFGPHGPLAGNLPGFRPRPQQLSLARAVERALKEGRPCLAEAGTGVGKTLAYLVPALRWLDKNAGRIVVSTHTLGLQTQLAERDIPNLLASVPNHGVTAAVLKGRSNFVCLQDLNVAATDLTMASDPLFRRVQRWAAETDCGDHAELDFRFPAWYEVCANQDTCRGRECTYYDRCFYFRARKSAEDARLLIVNHALFFADLRLRRANPGAPSLIPDYEVVVFDEAHHVEETATRAFGLEWGSGRIPQLAARVRRLSGLDMTRVSAVEGLNQALCDPFTLVAPDAAGATADGAPGTASTEAFLDELVHTEEDREVFSARRDELCVSLDVLCREILEVADAAGTPSDKERAAGLARTTSRISSELRQVTTDDPNGDEEASFRWYATRRMRTGYVHTTLIKTPLRVARILEQTLLSRTPRCVFVSATLASGGRFDYLRSRLGLASGDGASAEEFATMPPIEVLEGSPFEFERNCLLYVPRNPGSGGPFGAAGAQADRIADEVANIVEAVRGRTFALFTSYRILRAVQERLKGRSPYPVFAQGDLPNARLVEAFVASGNGVLLGTNSFWEGVDVPGPALSCVIIDKLPFAMPDAPVQRARLEAIRKAGGDPFRELSLPQAQIRLKQGFGRLLRTETDRGAVCILDNRLWTKAYGREMLADLPPCPRTDRLDDVCAFFAEGAELNDTRKVAKISENSFAKFDRTVTDSG